MVANILAQLREQWNIWIEKHALSARAAWWLGAVSFLESSILIFPIDFLLIAILLAGAERWAYYAGITTLWSIIGGIFGYLIGFSAFEGFGDALIAAYGLEQAFETTSVWFQANALWAVFFAGFVPIIPFKIFTLSAGVFQAPFVMFVAASTLSRGIRFFAIAYIMRRYGASIGKVILRHFNIATIITLVLFLLFLLF
ncbi:MAG: hypothetical protein COW88_03235 [Candidatus Lloydbacteria bacterium CG22_combo_CG10-13_8_21_14_all_47_15]|uniref:VTT domain-containing protein n=1 Tax=Candidatus Lloydbacteria bacterium CG22_combo_CG10-13_8_21_14_all_47_15 TaxID=1974635 RepID=A0A2H0CT03_9BACT|nr:MAG: hypothetical protein COW88_03235 [Candidatus Lloydbacteria bacterium CG22_combo_CG10-13_8_21_14_all_47_15]